jgi:NAD(P)-dependent dehydrogenase (short-subunit alcohol dehydrogenase family)
MGEAVAVVTGVSRGLGESLAFVLMRRGFDVVGVGRQAASRLASPHFRLVNADLQDISALAVTADALFAEIAVAAPQRVVLINNAAVAGPVGLVGSLDEREVAASIAIDFTAPLLLANAFVHAFRAKPGDRRLINVSSGAAVQALPGTAVYCAGKAALEMATRCIAAENSGIVAIAVRPGIIDTPMQQYVRSQPRERLPVVDVFKEFHAGGQLVPPDVTATKIVDRLVLGPVEAGRIYSYAEL